MNGRVYDYNVGRFMSVDPVIQSPGNSQSINPYSYIMNNPLAGTDPTGYCSTSDTGQSCSDSLEKGETRAITNEAGETVGHVGKDADGKVHITSNGTKEGQAAVANVVGASFVAAFELNAQEGISKTNPLVGGGGKAGKGGTIANNSNDASSINNDSKKDNVGSIIEKSLNFITGNGFKSHEEVYVDKAKRFGTQLGCEQNGECIDLEFIALYEQYTAIALGAVSPGNVIAQGSSKTLNGARNIRASVPMTVDKLQANWKLIWGKNVEEINAVFKSGGYNTKIKQSTRGSQNSTLIRVTGHKHIQQIQVHAGQGRHGGSYYKISTTNQGTIKVINPKTYKFTDEKNVRFVNGVN